MPYSGISDSSLPDFVKKLPKHKQEIWVAAWNSAYKAKQDEGYAFRVANAAIKKELTVDEVEKVLDELDKAGARHSAADLKMFDQVATALKDVAAGITEGVLPLLERLKGIDSMKPAEQASEDQPKTEVKPAEPAEKRDVDPNVVGSPDRDRLKAGDFVDGENRRFPVMGKDDVMAAVHSFGRMGEPKMPFDEFKRKLIALCRRKGFMDALPKSWKEGLKKAENLDERTMKVRMAFNKQFNMKDEYDASAMMGMGEISPHPWVREVWDEYAIVEFVDKGDCLFFKANYRSENDGIVFDKPDSWDQVEQVWQVVPMTRNIIMIGKQDSDKQLVYGVVLKPSPFEDSQGDIMEKDEIEAAAHQFMEESRLYDLFHKSALDAASVVPVESYVAPQDLVWGGKTVPAGSWVVVSHVKDTKIWEKIKKGQINAYSIKGVGHRKEL